MFERLTADARQALVEAQAAVRELRHDWIGTEHLLVGVLGQRTDPAVRVVLAYGLDAARARAEIEQIVGRGGPDRLDAGALATLGIDLDEVRRRVEALFGPGALDRPSTGSCRTPGNVPFTPRTKKVIELALREAISLRSASVCPGHMLAGMLRDGEGVGAKILTAHGLTLASVRAAMRTGPQKLAS